MPEQPKMVHPHNPDEQPTIEEVGPELERDQEKQRRKNIVAIIGPPKDTDIKPDKLIHDNIGPPRGRA